MKKLDVFKEQLAYEDKKTNKRIARITLIVYHVLVVY